MFHLFFVSHYLTKYFKYNYDHMKSVTLYTNDDIMIETFLKEEYLYFLLFFSILQIIFVGFKAFQDIFILSILIDIFSKYNDYQIEIFLIKYKDLNYVISRKDFLFLKYIGLSLFLTTFGLIKFFLFLFLYYNMNSIEEKVELYYPLQEKKTEIIKKIKEKKNFYIDLCKEKILPKKLE